jgi:hypothetical protein
LTVAASVDTFASRLETSAVAPASDGGDMGYRRYPRYWTRPMQPVTGGVGVTSAGALPIPPRRTPPPGDGRRGVAFMPGHGFARFFAVARELPRFARQFQPSLFGRGRVGRDGEPGGAGGVGVLVGHRRMP